MVTAILTCFNRKEKTIQCLRSLVEGNSAIDFSFVVVDDASTDGTTDSLEELRNEGYAIHLINGNGGLFWSGGMREGIEYAKKQMDTEYYMLVNDDVSFYKGTIERMVQKMDCEKNQVLIGAVCDHNGNLSYGGVCYEKGSIKYSIVGPDSVHIDRAIDTFNANCVLIEKEIFLNAPNIDPKYVHSLGDFDYGLTLHRMNVTLELFGEYVGICPDNDVAGTWQDTSLSRSKRLRLKESPKGAPLTQWYYFLKKNFGMKQALSHAFTPFLRILLGR